ncbi:MAG: flippase-like domain-containing protein [Myxococcales bacterium]|nr:flippase-like domain-containing protein [Myxococcales bacterium]
MSLGAVGAYLGAPEAHLLRIAWHRLGGAPVATLAIIVGGALGLVATEAIRISVIGRLVGARVTRRDAWDAAVANHLMTAITPQVGLGEPTVAYLLHTRGVAWDAAVAIPFLKFTTSLALVFAIGAGLVVAGYGPPVDGWIAASGLALFAAIAVVTVGVLVVCGRPALARRMITRVRGWAARRRWFASAAWQGRITSAAEVAERMIERLDRVRRTTWRGAAILVLVHLLYYASYIAPLVGLALVLGDPPLVALTLRALIYLCFVFAMPTPGGAGPSEAAAGLFFADLVAPADAIVVVAVFRAATFYLQLAIGIVYLPVMTALRNRG